MSMASTFKGREVPWAFPPPWVRQWHRGALSGDASAGLVVAIVLVPQGLAYAMLAGLPPQAGLLASFLPLLAYALFGSSRVLSVGPAAITSLMVAQALAPLAVQGSITHVAMAKVLALGAGMLMALMGVLRMGFLSQLLSRPVVQGFTVASAALILVGQAAPLLGWGALGYTLPDMAHAWWGHARSDSPVMGGDALVGGVSLGLLWGARPAWMKLARLRGWPAARVALVTRVWPVAALLTATAFAAWLQGLPGWQLALVGPVSLHSASEAQAWTHAMQWDAAQWSALMVPALLIGMVSFVSSVSVAQTFAMRHGERVDADRELLGLGLANLGSTVLGGLPVAGGLSRSVVNDAAGARSPMAGVFSALLLALLLATAMPWMAYLPKAALAAVIISGVAGLIEWGSLRAAWRYDRAEAWAFLSTALGVLLVGFEAGILLGMAWSMGAMVWRHSQPHMAEVGRLKGSEHFRNVARHRVQTLPGVCLIRIDESLDFTNIQRVEQGVCELIHARAGVHDVVLMLSAVNHIDHTAAQALLALDRALADQGTRLHLAEVKGPVMDRLHAGQVAQIFAGRTHLSAQQAWEALGPARVAAAL